MRDQIGAVLGDERRRRRPHAWPHGPRARFAHHRGGRREARGPARPHAQPSRVLRGAVGAAAGRVSARRRSSSAGASPPPRPPPRSAEPAPARCYVLTTPGCPVDALAPWLGGAADVVVDEALADDVDGPRPPGGRAGCGVRPRRPPSRSPPSSAAPCRSGTPRSAGPRPTATSSTWPSGWGRRAAPSCATRTWSRRPTTWWTAWPSASAGASRSTTPGEPTSTRPKPRPGPRVTLAQRPGRSVRVVADELGYDVTWPPPGRGGPPPAPVPPPPEAPAVPLAPSGPAAPAAAEAAPPIAPISRELPLEVSSAQEQLLFVDDLQPGLAIYNLPTAARLRGPLDVAALESAFSEIVRRHEALRTNYEVPGRPLRPGGRQTGAGVPRLRGSPVGADRAARDGHARAHRRRGGAPVRPAVRSQDPRPFAADRRRRARPRHDDAPHRVGRRLDRHLRR